MLLFSVRFLIRRNLDRNLISSVQPAAEVDQFAAFAAEREISAGLIRSGFNYGFLADGANHWPDNRAGR